MNASVQLQTTSQEWDALRASFLSSIMVDTSLHSLAQNLDGIDWPIRSKDETPAKYVDLALGDVIDLLALKGQSPALVDKLASILRDTLAFDEPFGEMVVQVSTPKPQDNTLLKNLARLGIPENFPIRLAALSEDTQEFCRLEKLETLGQFATFSQNLAQSVIVGGNFRELLNALVHIDEETLCRLLPLRHGTKGPQLFEALALILRRNPAGIQVNLAARAGFQRKSAERIRIAADLLDAAESELRIACAELCSGYFKSQAEELKTEVAAGTPLERLLSVLDDPAAEAVVAATLTRVLLAPKAPARLKQGFWLRFFTHFQHA